MNFKLYKICFFRFCAIICAIFVTASLQGCFDIKIKTQTPSVGYYSLPSVLMARDCAEFLAMRLEVEVASEFNTTNIFIEGANGRIEPLKDSAWLDLPSNLIKTSLETKAQSKCIALSSTNVDSKNPLLQVKVFSFGIAKINDSLVATVNMNIRLSHDLPQNLQTKKNELNTNIHTKIEVAQVANTLGANDTNAQILAIKDALDKALEQSIERVNSAISTPKATQKK